MSWLIKTVAGLFGISDGAALATIGWIGFLGFGIACAVLTGLWTHHYDTVTCDLRAATRKAAHDKAVQDQTDATLERERKDRAAKERLEEAYAEQSRAREAAEMDGARPSGELADALERLRRAGAVPQGGGKLPTAANGAGGCNDLRTALDRATRALELYEAEGDRVALDGQRAVDVASVAALAARQLDKGGR